MEVPMFKIDKLLTASAIALFVLASPQVEADDRKASGKAGQSVTAQPKQTQTGTHTQTGKPSQTGGPSVGATVGEPTESISSELKSSISSVD
jgi:hypothetical protein